MAAVLGAAFVGTSPCHSETFFTRKIPAAPGMIVVDCTIEGAAKQLMFDTGAGMIVLKKEYEREKSEMKGQGQSHGGETFTVNTGVGPTIAFDAFRIEKPTCVLMDLPAGMEQLGPQVVGILGMDPVIAGSKLYFDLEKSLMTAHSGDWMIDGEARTLALAPSVDTPRIAAEIGGQKVTLVVDTGSAVSFTLPKAVFDTLAEEGVVRKLDLALEAQTATGTAKLEAGVFLKGELMGKALRGVEVLVGKDPGTVGLPWLRRFNFEIAFSDRAMRFRPAKAE